MTNWALIIAISPILTIYGNSRALSTKLNKFARHLAWTPPISFCSAIHGAAYTASKHAIAGVTKALANEWAPSGVNVNAVAPGYVATDNTRALRDDEARSRAILERIPAGRWGEPEDIAGAVLFLASPASDYVNGTVLPVDGGWLGR